MKIRKISLISFIVLMNLGYISSFHESHAESKQLTDDIAIIDSIIYDESHSKADIYVQAINPNSSIKRITLNSETILNSSAIFEVTEPGQYNLTVEDENNNQVSKVITVDKLNFSPSSGVKDIEYKLDANSPTWLKYKDILNISSQGVINLITRAIDNVGNYSEETSTVVKIDKEKPLILSNVKYNDDNSTATLEVKGIDSLSGIESITINGEEYSDEMISIDITENKEVHIIAKDKSGLISEKTISIDEIGKNQGSGLKIIEYRLEGSTNNEWSPYTDMFTLTSNGVTNIIARALDNAGNYSEEVLTPVKIDKKSPLITSNVRYNENNSEANIDVSVSDEHSGVKYILSENNTEIKSDNYSFKSNSNGTYLISAVDNVGNVSIESIEINQINNDDNSISGLKEIQYKLEGATNQDWTTYNGQFKILNEGITTVYAKALDNAGNISSEVSISVKIDKEKPNILYNIIYDSDKSKARIELNVSDTTSGVKHIIANDNETITSTNHSFEVTENGNYLVSAVDNAGNVNFTSIIVDGLNNGNSDVIGIKEIKYKLEGDTVQDWTTYDGQFKILNEGITVVKAKAYDKAGNISDELSIVVKIDKTIPDIIEQVSYNKDFTEATISVSSSDNLSGVNHIISESNNIINSNKHEFTVTQNGNYLVSAVDVAGNIAFKGIQVDSLKDSNKPSDIGKIEYKLEGATTQDWTVYNKPLTISKEGTTTVKAKIYDIAGNVSDEAFVIVNIDKSSPIISNSISYNVDNTEANITVVASDRLSGVKHITSSNNEIVTSNTHTFKVDNNGNYLVSATDIAGNIGFETINVSGINGKDNPSEIDRIEYKLEGATIKDWTTYTDIFKVINEGTTIVTGRAIDRAGNTSDEIRLEVKIDKTKPSNNQITIRPL